MFKNGLISINQLLNSSAPKRDVQLTPEEYDQFKKEFTMIALNGEDYANAFCRYFKIVDYILSGHKKDTIQADKYITKTYVNKKRRNVIEYYDYGEAE